jgi:hypothetical protein
MINQSGAFEMLDAISTPITGIADFYRYVYTGYPLPRPMKNTWIF